MTEAQAIQRLKKGDIGGMEELVVLHQQNALRVACLITRDEEMAKDAVQETFLRIYQRIRYFDESKPFEPYLLRSVVNTAINLAEKRSKEVGLEEDLPPVDMQLLFLRATSTEDLVEYRQLKQEILDGISRLAPRERAVIIERYYLDLSEKEMAEKHDVAPGTVKWLLNVARKKLRTFMGKESDPS
ncbi:ECF RNA polymerase sigma factor SigW [bioreactor metagenome]|uniref:ECF RNA polymerase sigma factor SigW n=1 Tax=bioreactor metagenome TaxID=1076179 RepID=A0A644ZJ68_9ZZZZ